MQSLTRSTQVSKDRVAPPGPQSDSETDFCCLVALRDGLRMTPTLRDATPFRSVAEQAQEKPQFRPGRTLLRRHLRAIDKVLPSMNLSAHSFRGVTAWPLQSVPP